MLIPLLFLASTLGFSFDHAREAPATLERVTVYNGQALVERRLSVSSEDVGPMIVTTGPFSLKATADSFQVKHLEGPAVVQGVEMRRRVGYALSGTQRDAMQSELAGLNQEKLGVMAQIKAVEAARSAIDVLLEGVASGKSVPALSEMDGDQILEWVGQQVGKLEESLSKLQSQWEQLDLRIADLQQSLGDRSEQHYQEARIQLYFERPGEVQLRVAYLVQDASWKPSYDVRVNPDLTGVTVGLVAQVTQNSGEDWEETQLVLSTSQPDLGLNPPDLPTRSFHVPAPMIARGLMSPPSEAVVYGGRLMEMDSEATDSKAYSPAPVVQVQDYGLSTQFVLPETKTVLSNGELHRFLIREVPLEVYPERYVVPSLSEHAYLRAEVRLTGDAPLLAGKAKIFLGPDLLGEAQFPVLRPGDATMLNLGIDPNLTVSWETLSDDRDEPGWLGSTVRTTRIFRSTLKLSASARGPVSVLVEEVLPMSRDQRIEVTPTQLQPLPLEGEEDLKDREEKGVYRWRLRLPPGASQNIRWGYYLSYDEDLTPVFREDR